MPRHASTSSSRLYLLLHPTFPMRLNLPPPHLLHLPLDLFALTTRSAAPPSMPPSAPLAKATWRTRLYNCLPPSRVSLLCPCMPLPPLLPDSRDKHIYGASSFSLSYDKHCGRGKELRVPLTIHSVSLSTVANSCRWLRRALKLLCVALAHGERDFSSFILATNIDALLVLLHILLLLLPSLRGPRKTPLPTNNASWWRCCNICRPRRYHCATLYMRSTGDHGTKEKTTTYLTVGTG